ncbi:hypothetical protein ACT7CX_29340 [Bacillus cereus]
MKVLGIKKKLKLTLQARKNKKQILCSNALATVVEMDPNIGREQTTTHDDLIELMNIGTDYALDPA